MHTWICLSKEKAEQKLADHYATHPIGFSFFMLITLPIGVLLAVMLCTFLAGGVMGMLLGWI